MTKEILMPVEDARTLDRIVHMLGIEDSHINPCEVIQTLLDDRNPEALVSLIDELEDLIGPRLKHKIGTPDRWEEYEQIIDICKRLRVLSPKGVQEDIIIGACNLLDTIKYEWGDQWSEWDQSIRDGLSAALAKSMSPSHDISGKLVAPSSRTATWFDTNDPDSLDERGPHD